MYYLKVESSFDAAHFLPGYKGPCANMHGHHWKIQACYRYDERIKALSNEVGLSLDFVSLKANLQTLCQLFDHHTINELIEQPTAEHIAQNIYNRLASMSDGEYLSHVIVYETANSSVMYFPTGNTKDKSYETIPNSGNF